MLLNDRAMLVQLSISQWTARKYDRKATRQVVEANSASTAAGRFNKSLLPAESMLDAIQRKSTAIRTYYYLNTLPWGTDGTQMLPTANYLAFVSEFRTMRSEWQRLVRNFVLDYDTLVADAQKHLGALYDPSDYPSSSRIEGKFNIDLAVMPVPTSDFRVDIASDELARIQQDVEARVKQAGEAAMKDVWDRLFAHVKHISEKLSDPAGIFRDSMIENARQTCSLLTRLNFTDDPQLEAMRREVEGALLQSSPNTLRNDVTVRQTTADKAREIMRQMGAYMQGETQ